VFGGGRVLLPVVSRGGRDRAVHTCSHARRGPHRIYMMNQLAMLHMGKGVSVLFGVEEDLEVVCVGRVHES
jgi:hypothetical protein